MGVSDNLKKLGELAYKSNLPKYNLPTNVRALALGLANKDPNLVVTEQFLRPNDIKMLREAYRNSTYNYNPDKKNYLDYGNYPNGQKNFFIHKNDKGQAVGDNWMEIIAKSILDPSYNMQTTIGRTNVPYTRNNKGEIIIRDSYDFNFRKPTKTNSAFDDAHMFAYDKVTPYQWNINLGNPKDW